MKLKLIFTAITTLFLLSNCTNNSVKNANASFKNDLVKTETVIANQNHNGKIADAATILARKQVPILCYHQIRNWTASDSKSAKDYITPIETFKQHIKMLADSGYHSIQPDELYNYLAYGDALPTKPIMITFDDTDLDQYTTGATTLKKYGYKGVYFIMTVSIGKRGKYKYMDKTQIKELSDAGNTIGSHTYDHQNVKKYQGDDWVKQIEKPTKTLETITGKKIDHFAYPFGLWNPQAIPELKKRGFKDAYILSTKRDPTDPLFTIRRIIASGYWSAKTLHNSMINSFD
ncbi:MAG: polysaccharide deacetylase family protein [Sphingobacteriales bacterium]|nr:MAG: polysaccharide deacetylase family protein [Sphingobacteriales bacterium]